MGKSRSDKQAAQEALADQAHFVLPLARWNAFCAALGAPPKIVPALQQLITGKGVFDGPAAELRRKPL